MYEKKKVLFVGASFGGGGAERVMASIISSLSSDKYEIQAVMLFENRIDYDLPPDIKVEYIGNNRTNRYLKKLYIIFNLRNKIKSFSPDVIISFLSYCNMICCLAGIGIKHKLIVSERSDPKRNVSGKIVAFIRNILYKMSDCLVGQTKEAIDFFPQSIQKKAVVIPNPVSDFLPDIYRGKRSKNIIMVCRLNKQKNIPMAFKAFAKFHSIHPDWILDIYGEGEEKDSLVKFAKDLDIDKFVFFHGYKKNVIEYIRTAGIYLSTSDFEGISNSMIEALALGVPSVITDCPIGGARMMMQDVTGDFLIKVRDVEECFKKLCTLAEDSINKDIFIKKSINIRAEYNIEKIINAWENLIDLV